MRYRWLLAASLALGPADVGATPPEVPLGSRVRVRVEARTEPVVGTLAEWNETQLRVALGDQRAVVVPRAEIRQLEMLSKPSRKRKGAIIGASILGGTMLGLFVWYCGTDTGCQGTNGGRVAGLLAGSVLVGGLVGAGVAPGEQWRRVDLGVGLTKGGGVGARVSIAF